MHSIKVEDKAEMNPAAPIRPHTRAATRRVVAVLFLLAVSYFYFRNQLYRAPKTVSLTALRLQDLSGAPIPAESLKGRAVVFNFWAPWCPPCRQELPWLDALQARNPGTAVIGLEDDPDKLDEAVALANALKLKYLLAQPNDAVTNTFGHVAGLPTTLYISPSGKVVHTVSGVIPQTLMQRYLTDAIEAH